MLTLTTVKNFQFFLCCSCKPEESLFIRYGRLPYQLYHVNYSSKRALELIRLKRVDFLFSDFPLIETPTAGGWYRLKAKYTFLCFCFVSKGMVFRPFFEPVEFIGRGILTATCAHLSEWCSICFCFGRNNRRGR